MRDRKREIFITYGNNLKNIREKNKVTLKELSIKTKINIQYLKKIEKGEAYGLTVSKIFLIANALKTQPHVFVENI